MGVGSLGVRVCWPKDDSGVDGVPSGWTRDTLCNDRFLQGADENYAGPANAGGSHDHTANPHTHIGNPHRHGFTSAESAPASTDIKIGTRFPVAGFDVLNEHSHTLANGAYSTIVYPNNIVTIDSEDAMPPYMKLIVIKPDRVTEDIPDDAVCYTDETALPTGFAKYAPLDDSFVRAPSDDADADLAGFGDATHDHNSPTHGHAPPDIHDHTDALCGTSDPTQNSLLGDPVVSVHHMAHHNVGMGTKVLPGPTRTAVTVAATSSEPAYIKLLGIQNTSGSPTTPVGVIVAFVGAAGTVPSNWQLCNGVGDTLDCRDKQIWSTAADGEIGDVGGSDEHTHTITGNHNHTHSAHDHPTGSVTMTGIAARQTGTPSEKAIPQIGGIHTHTWTINTTVPTLQAAAVTLDGTEDVRSAYRTVIWIKKLIERPGPTALLGTTF